MAIFPSVRDTGPEPIAEIGKTTIWAAVLNEPWKLDIDAFVIPTGPQGDLAGSLAETLRTIVGSDWMLIERRYREALPEAASFDPDTPLVIEAQVKVTKARFFIFATGVSGKDSRAADATRAIVALTRRYKIANLGLPLLGSGRAGAASSEDTAEAMLRALASEVRQSPLLNVYITTLSSAAFERLGKLASEINKSKPPPVAPGSRPPASKTSAPAKVPPGSRPPASETSAPAKVPPGSRPPASETSAPAKVAPGSRPPASETSAPAEIPPGSRPPASETSAPAKAAPGSRPPASETSPPAEPADRQTADAQRSPSQPDGAGTPPPESSFRPAVEVVEQLLLVTQEAALDDGARRLIAQAGHVAFVRRQHNDDGRLLTTSTFLFAMVEQGRRTDQPPLQLLGSVIGGTTERYLSQLNKYLGERALNPDFGDAETRVAATTPNVERLLIRAVAIQREAGANVVGTAALALALLENPGLFSDQLAALQLKKEDLQREIGTGLRRMLRRPGPPPPAQPDALANFWTDNPNASVEDYLNVKKEVEAFARLAANKRIDPPLSIGVFGEWGSGKTFFMERMHERIEEMTKAESRNQETGELHSDIVQIRFNAWHYIETNLWASLVEFIFFELDRWLSARDTPRVKIDALFDQLATSKQLQLDAVRDLLASRRSLTDATAELTTARANYARAVKEHARLSPADVVGSVWDTFISDPSVDRRIRRAAADLGVERLGQSRDELRALIEDTRGQGARARLLGQSLMVRLGSPWVAGLSVAAILLVPFAAEWLRHAIAEAYRWSWLKEVNGGVLGITSVVGAATLIGRKLLNRGIEGLNALDRLRDGLERKVAEKTEKERDDLVKAEKHVAEQQQVVSTAEQKVTSAANLAAAAELEYANDTSRGRLNKFIREKVAKGDYAKHLGIIATIRKDFDQLAGIMNAETSSEDAEKELKASRQSYRSKLLALVKMYDVRRTKLLKLRELQELADKPKRGDLPFFRRIILYIDDLDRCPPEKVAEVLQAIHMLLFFPLFVVVVAVDARWIARSLETEFPHLLREGEKPATSGVPPKPPDGGQPAANPAPSVQDRPLSGADTATAQDYLEKIFQIPFWVRRMNEEASRLFVGGLAKRKVKSEAEKQPVVAAPKPVTPPGGEIKLPPIDQPVDDPKVGPVKVGPDKPPGEKPPGDKPPDDKPPDGKPPDDKPPDGKPPDGKPPGDKTVTMDAAPLEVASFTEDEIGLLEEFAPFVGGSPRRAKRFVNLYHLLRLSLRELPFVGNEVVLHQRALIAALAVVTGAPHSASAFFNALERPPGGWYPSLDAIVLDPSKSGGAAVDANLRGILERLKTINDAGTHNDGQRVSNGPEFTEALSKLSDTVRRYSFEMVK